MKEEEKQPTHYSVTITSKLYTNLTMMASSEEEALAKAEEWAKANLIEPEFDRPVKVEQNKETLQWDVVLS